MRSKFKWIFTLLLAFKLQFSLAQEKTVTGVVSDNAGPTFGANVVVDGTKRGTQTDMDGKYSINVNQGETLMFSYIGMETQSVKVGSSAKINVKLVASGAIKLDDVMITGALGIKRKKDAQTNSQQQVKGAEIRQAANPNIIQSLAGKVSGMQINTASNGVDPTTSIVLRGSRTLTGNNQALVVIDGAISTADILGQLPPDIVESVNVIKGQQGSALYGQQGSNGVIIVTTKKGSGSKTPIISLNSSVDFTSVLFVPKTQQEYGQGWAPPNDEVFDDGTGLQGYHTPVENGSWGPAFNAPHFAGTLQATGLPLPDGSFRMLPWSPVKDNIKKFFQTGTVMQNGISINMGDENGYSLLSINRLTNDFVVKGDDLTRNSFLFKAGKKMMRWSIDGSANYISQKTSRTSADLLDNLLQTPTNIPLEQFSDPNNYQHWTLWSRSPYWIQKNVRYDDSNDMFNGTAALGYEINKHINVKYTGNMQFTNNIHEYHNDGQVYDFTYNLQAPYTFNGHSSFTFQDEQGLPLITSQYYVQNSHFRNYYGDLLVNLDFDLTKNINMKVNIGQNTQDRFTTYVTNGGLQLYKPGIYNVNNLLQIGSIINDSSNPDSYTPTEFVSGSKLFNKQFRTRVAAEFINADFAYKDYLFLNLTARHEKTSVVTSSQFYPSAGLSYILSKGIEGMKDKKTLNYAKVFANYTVTGNSSTVGIYQTYGSAGVLGVGYPMNNINSYVFNQNQTNPSVTPEYVYTKEVGVNLGFLNHAGVNRITFDTSIYQSDTKQLITNSGTSSAAGNNSLLTNVGSLRNRGIEIDLGLIPIKTNDFRWDLRASFTSYKTIVTSLANGVNTVPILSDTTYNVGIYAVVGEQFPMIRGTAYQRDPSGNIIVDSKGVPLTTTNLQDLGKATPDYILGFTNNLEYKGVRLTTVLDFRTGNKFWSATKNIMTFSGTDMDTADYDRNQGYLVPGSVQNTGTAANPVYTQNTTAVGSNGGYAGATSYFSGVNHRSTAEAYIIDGTALKVRELALSYGLPVKVVKKMGLSSFRFGINARNPFILLAKDNRYYSDPEATYVASSPKGYPGSGAGTVQGYQNVGQYPTTKSYGFSVNLTF